MSFPYSLRELTLELTRYCYLKCKHCSSFIPESSCRSEDLTLSKFASLVYSAKELGCEELYLSGGEPLSFGAIIPFLEKIEPLNIKVFVYSSGVIGYSNGTIFGISSDFANKLKMRGVEKIIFHLASATSSIHDFFTQQRGSFRVTMNSMKTCVSAEIPVELNFVPTSINWFELHNLVRLSYELRGQRLNILRFVPQGRGALNKEELLMGTTELNQFKREIELLSQDSTRVPLKIGAPFNCLFPEKSVPCNAGRSRLLVRSNGDTFPCEAFKHSPVDSQANLKHNNLQNIWENSPLIIALRQFDSSKLGYPCNSCQHRELCGGGCPGQRALSWGSIYAGFDPICPLINNIKKNSFPSKS